MAPTRTAAPALSRPQKEKENFLIKLMACVSPLPPFELPSTSASEKTGADSLLSTGYSLLVHITI